MLSRRAIKLIAAIIVLMSIGFIFMKFMGLSLIKVIAFFGIAFLCVVIKQIIMEHYYSRN
jgi:hypothetical protein